MRINSYLAKCSLGSRRKVEELVKNGSVFINGKQLGDLSYRVGNEDKVTVNGLPVEIARPKYYFINKPTGYSSTVSDPHAQKKVIDLVPEIGLFPVGRLDRESEGLMILTNDGEFAQKLMHPKYEHEREYIVTVKLPVKNRTIYLDNALKFFKCGVKIDSKRSKPAQISLESQLGDTAIFRIILTEGIKRQIRRTFEKAKLKVLGLKRIRISGYVLGDLRSGQWREFDPSSKVKPDH